METGQSNRPKNRNLYQQQLKAWKPLLTFGDAAVFFIVTGAILLGIGVAIYFADQKVIEQIIDYTQCLSVNASLNNTCANIIELLNSTCTCQLNIYINTSITAPVYFYYGMSQYYQNFRQLINSYDIVQLIGVSGEPSITCLPLWKDNMSNYYAPCGQMANVIFNDTFILKDGATDTIVPWTNKGIALQSDLLRYKNPGQWNNTIKPPNWPLPINEMFANGYADNQELMVWMRPAPLPTWRKLHRILNTSGVYQRGLPNGTYSLLINYNYPAQSFGGKKYFIISNTSWVGGKNSALFIIYFITGTIEIIIGLFLIPMHIKATCCKTKRNSIIMAPTF